MSNRLPNAFLPTEVEAFNLDEEVFLTAIAPSLPTAPAEEPVSATEPDSDHTTTAPEYETFDLERLALLAWTGKK